MKKLVVLTGAGMSAESGLSTFRDSGGLWEGHRVEDVASPDGWNRDPQKVLNFYNERRRQLLKAVPNQAHIALAKFETEWDISIITQNVDDLHERAGSTNVLHLHGELLRVCSTKNRQLQYPWTKDLKLGDYADDGEQLRPDIVWFGEMVPKLVIAEKLCHQADALLIVGTSLQVYPAAGLVYAVTDSCPIVYLDPMAESNFNTKANNQLKIISKKAVKGIEEAFEIIRHI